MKTRLIAFLCFAAIAASIVHAQVAQSATVIVNRGGGTASTKATGVRMVYTDVAPVVDVNGIPTATTLPGQVVAFTFTGNNPTTMTATAVPLKKLWVTWQPFNADGPGQFMKPVIVDLSGRGAPDPLDGSLTSGTINVTINVNKGGIVNVAVDEGTPLRITKIQ